MVSRCVLRSAPLPLWPLLPSVGFGSASGAAFCCKGWAFGHSGPFICCAAKGLFGWGPISMEWSPRWAAFLADGQPFQILHLPEVLLWPWLGRERLWVVVSLVSTCIRGGCDLHYASPPWPYTLYKSPEWMNEWMKHFTYNTHCYINKKNKIENNHEKFIVH